MDSAAPPAVQIDNIAIDGVTPEVARGVGPAIEQALAQACREGLLAPRAVANLRFDLPAGADARMIARALVRALARGGRG
ncbi:MAG: hypothetical protein IOC52_10400 [Methylobacterium sp.]|jgi:hypothetical protein|nr:hypothetical protein [Methylobacterium sp.]